MTIRLILPVERMSILASPVEVSQSAG